MKKAVAAPLLKCQHALVDNTYCKKCGALYKSLVLLFLYFNFHLVLHRETSKILLQCRY